MTRVAPLLWTLWHPWRARWRTHTRIRALRREVDALHHRQEEAAMSLLARPENVHALVDRLGPRPGRRTDGVPGPAVENPP